MPTRRRGKTASGTTPFSLSRKKRRPSPSSPVHIGKDGLGENLVKQADDALEARELIKCRVLENAMLSPREAADALSRATRSEVVQVIGTKFVLYRQSHNKDKKDRIALVK